MKRSDFHYDLPEGLIAHYPLKERTASRLLCLDGASGKIDHRQFPDLLDLLNPDDLLVLNDTRVIPARLWGSKATGGRVEVLVERLLSATECLAHVRASKSPRPGTRIDLRKDGNDGPAVASLMVQGREGELFRLACSQPQNLSALLEQVGHTPLPPYIDRDDEHADRERYQTVYGERDGAVAAPTAGLHFSKPFIESCRSKGVEIGRVTLHVGAGTFQPVRVDDIEDHHMHAEYMEVNEQVCQQVRATRQRGGRVVAVGTTAVRSLETAAADGELQPRAGDSRLFIYPGFRFRVVDALVTNFHLPESTLIMLVSAFAGRDHIMTAYREAVAQAYRFFSYGDAMFLLPTPEAR